MKRIVSRGSWAALCASALPMLSVALLALGFVFPEPGFAFQDRPVYTIGADVTAPVVVESKQPEYTPEARAGRVQGSVKLRAVIDPFGVPTDVEVVESLEPGLDAEAVDAVKKWRFKPATKSGEPVAVSVNLTILFRLL